jgi:hypothetical protein
MTHSGRGKLADKCGLFVIVISYHCCPVLLQQNPSVSNNNNSVVVVVVVVVGSGGSGIGGVEGHLVICLYCTVYQYLSR